MAIIQTYKSEPTDTNPPTVFKWGGKPYLNIDTVKETMADSERQLQEVCHLLESVKDCKACGVKIRSMINKQGICL